METDLPKNLLIRRLAEKHRVLLLGGMASILREFEAEGDPFSRDLLATWNNPA